MAQIWHCCSSGSTPSPGAIICHRCGLKNKNKNRSRGRGVRVAGGRLLPWHQLDPARLPAASPEGASDPSVSSAPRPRSRRGKRPAGPAAGFISEPPAESASRARGSLSGPTRRQRTGRNPAWRPAFGERATRVCCARTSAE